MVLAVGSTGMLGGEIVRRLLDERAEVRALVRPTADPAKVDALRALGAEVVAGDLKDAASLSAACAGADAVVSSATAIVSRADDADTIHAVDRDGQLALVEAAERAGARRFVLVSFPPFEPDFPLQEAKREVARRLESSALEHTVLEAGHFMEVRLSPIVGFDAANATARVYGDGSARISWVSAVRRTPPGGEPPDSRRRAANASAGSPSPYASDRLALGARASGMLETTERRVAEPPAHRRRRFG